MKTFTASTKITPTKNERISAEKTSGDRPDKCGRGVEAQASWFCSPPSSTLPMAFNGRRHWSTGLCLERAGDKLFVRVAYVPPISPWDPELCLLWSELCHSLALLSSSLDIVSIIKLNEGGILVQGWAAGRLSSLGLLSTSSRLKQMVEPWILQTFIKAPCRRQSGFSVLRGWT